MTLQTIPGGVNIPDYIGWRTVPSFASLLIDASGERAAAILKVPKTGIITKVGFLTRTVTTSQTLRVSLETVTNGDPSGTLYGGSAAGTQTAPASNTFYTVTLGTAATATKGDLIAVVIDFDSTVGSVNIGAIGLGCIFPYCDLFTTSWTRSNLSPVISLEYNDGSYEYMGTMPMSALNLTWLDSGSTPDEWALQFSLPFPTRAIGCWIHVDGDNPFDVVLYEGTTELTSVSLDANIRGLNADAVYIFIPFATAQSLSANTTYYLAIKPTTTSTVRIASFDVAASAVMGCFLGGTNFVLATRADSGAWSTTDTSRPFMGIVVDQFDDGAGGGGGLRVHPGMNGGING